MRKILAAQALAATMLAGMVVGAVPAPDNVPRRGMVWAHYVPWNGPADVSCMTCYYYDHPCHDGGEGAWREEIERAIAVGIEGFFIDIEIFDKVHNPQTQRFRWIEAARGTDFKVGICIDHIPSPQRCAEELVWLLEKYGDHPNYPRLDGRYVVSTYASWRLKPAQWREILDLCAAAGRPVFLVMDVKHGTGPVTPAVMAQWDGVCAGMYMFAYVGQEEMTFGEENRGVSEFCKRHGKLFMASVTPGYIGGWLRNGNDFYKPFCGVDRIVDEFLSLRGMESDWFQITTWNDHHETTLEPTRLQPANPRLLRAFCDEYNGREPSAEKAEVLVAYRREEVPGTLMRFEAMRLPSREQGAVLVSGRLRDASGNVVAELEEKPLSNGWDRAEWLVRSADLAASPHLVPEFAMAGPDGRHREARFQPVFFALPWIENNTTIRNSFADRSNDVGGALDVTYADGCVRAALDLKAARPVRRAILYRNDRPLGQFSRGGGRPTLFLESRESPRNRAIEFSGCRVAARMSTSTLGRRDFFRLEFDSPDEDASVTVSNATARFTAAQLARERRLQVGPFELKVAPACTVRDEPPLNAAEGRFNLAVVDREPHPGDAFWVRFEMPDGTACETPVVYPFGNLAERRRITLLETATSLDSKNGHQGWYKMREYLTPPEEMPVTGCTPFERDVSPLMFRKARWGVEESLYDDFGFRAGNVKKSPDGGETTVLPFHAWPMAPGAVSFDILVPSWEGRASSRPNVAVIKLDGFREGFSLNLLADGRLEAVWSGGTKGPVWNRKIEHIAALESTRSIRDGQWHRVVLENDLRKLRIRIDGETDAERDADPFRAYGRCTVELPAGDVCRLRNLEIGVALPRP